MKSSSIKSYLSLVPTGTPCSALPLRPGPPPLQQSLCTVIHLLRDPVCLLLHCFRPRKTLHTWHQISQQFCNTRIKTSSPFFRMPLRVWNRPRLRVGDVGVWAMERRCFWAWSASTGGGSHTRGMGTRVDFIAGHDWDGWWVGLLVRRVWLLKGIRHQDPSILNSLKGWIGLLKVRAHL